MSATPTPWKITDRWAPGWRIAATIGNGSEDVAQVTTDANADLIVRAVNAHDELVQALVGIAIDLQPNLDATVRDCVRRARAALVALAKG